MIDSSFPFPPSPLVSIDTITHQIIYPMNPVQTKQPPSPSAFQQLINQIKSGNIPAVEHLIRQQGDTSMVNELDHSINYPPLHFAVLVDGDDISEQLVQVLIEHGADITFKDGIEQTVLFYACREGKVQCAERLLSSGLSMDESDKHGQTPLFYAVSENQLEIVRKYATKDRVNHVDRLADQTILYYAAKKGYIDMCRLLIEKGADINHVDRNNKSPADLARKNKYPEVAEYLVSEIKRFKEMSKEANANREVNANKEANKMSIHSQSVEESNLQRRKLKKEESKPIRQTYKIVHLNERGELHDLTEEEVRLMSRNQPELEALLANPEAIPQEVVDRSNVEQWEKAAGKLLAQCCKLKGSFWFQEAVDPVKFNILDYFDIISTPMDLGTLRKKLNHNCYSCLKEFTDELSLIWENCFKYNGQEHEISKCAKELEAGFKEYYVSYGLAKFEPEM